MQKARWITAEQKNTIACLTVGDFERMRYNNESLSKLLIKEIKDVGKLGWGEYGTNINSKECGGAQRMPDKENFNGVVEDAEYIVRRLTPTECARLQGFPDDWAKDVEGYSDAKEYKLWGNGIALPNALYVMEGIAETFKEQK